MFTYSSKKVILAENQITFSADAIANIKKDESLTVSVPTIWDDQILGSIKISEYDIIYICTHPRRFGQYNSVTDHRKIWNLANIPVGKMDGFYDTDDGRVYWGLYTTSGEKGFRMHLSSTVLLSYGASQTLPSESLYQLWKKYQLGFNKSIPQQLLNELDLVATKSYLLQYDDNLVNPSLNIYGHNADLIFSSPFNVGE